MKDITFLTKLVDCKYPNLLYNFKIKFLSSIKIKCLSSMLLRQYLCYSTVTAKISFQKDIQKENFNQLYDNNTCQNFSLDWNPVLSEVYNSLLFFFMYYFYIHCTSILAEVKVLLQKFCPHSLFLLWVETGCSKSDSIEKLFSQDFHPNFASLRVCH